MRNTAEKLSLMKKLYEMKERGPLTSGAKSFVSKHLKPVMHCLANHFSGNESLFLGHYPAFNHTTFAGKCCSGQGACCAVVPGVK
jgi:hypothetical protein